ncbi:MAG: hypothetical protein E7369_00025 [Clostridiales bacterium]|nr:hypothetical protein [Clostridiales bacterium]
MKDKFIHENQSIKCVYPVLGKGQINFSTAFRLLLSDAKSFKIKLSASNCFKLIVDGKMVCFGPDRKAHGFFALKEFECFGSTVVVEVHDLGVDNFCYVNTGGFFGCELVTCDGERFSALDFECYIISDRVRKVPRYSYQRGFSEIYKLGCDRQEFYRGGASPFERATVEEVKPPVFEYSFLSDPKIELHTAKELPYCGGVRRDSTLPLWRTRVITTVGTEIQGYKEGEFEDFSIDEASQFEYLESDKGCEYKYRVVDFGRAITGFLNLKVLAPTGGKVFVLYDELLTENKVVNFIRNDTANVYAATLTEGGEYKMQTFEPYTLRYGVIVCSKDMDVTLTITDFENPDASAFSFESEDKDIEYVMFSAKNSFVQNAVDVFMDCPSRERAGWLCDAYFTAVSERMFTGKNVVEEAFLNNYSKAWGKNLPQGMIPMSYPSEVYYGMFIPNWTLWYILELEKFGRFNPKSDILQLSKDKVYGILNYFTKFENELGLLEDLENWVFVEWSGANDPDHLRGVNVPSNILYVKAMRCAGKLYGDDALLNKADALLKIIIEMGFDGTLFVDNLVRDEKGRLVKTGLYSEVCQYYALWMDVLIGDMKEDLQTLMIDKFGRNRDEDFMPQVVKPNMFMGVYMRIDLLVNLGKREDIIKECRFYFSEMARKTGTLWEHLSPYASCDHGFASYASRWIVYALTGFDILSPKNVDGGDGVGIDCKVTIPTADGNIRIEVVDNKVRYLNCL